ncbi:MAG: sulfatase-like hydrolase/transferase [Phycisphaerales bacterium]|nr:sulfatase-like hydrolase/transferase [Phycisphaerales bacterium]
MNPKGNNTMRLVCSGLWMLLISGMTWAEDRPNVLILLADDLRPDAIGALGNPDVNTPNLDAMVKRGTTYTRAYCMGGNSGAVCAPSRAMLLSGQDRFQLPVDFLVPWGKATGEPVPPLLPERFREAGWRTFATGKWHQRRNHFQGCFDEGDAIFFGGMGPHTGLKVHEYDPNGVYPKSAAKPMDEFSSTGFADATIDFINTQSKKDQPFFAWVSFTAPHDPRTPPVEIRNRIDDDALTLPPNVLPRHPFDNGELEIRDEKLEAWPRTPEALRRHLGDYYGMIEQLDEQVGRILEALEASGEADNTIVVFLADHGLGMGSHGLLGKQNLYEHSAGAPVILAGKGFNTAERNAQLVYLHDLVPLLYQRTGVDAPENLHGWNPDKRVRNELVLNYRDLQRALVEERWKLIVYPRPKSDTTLVQLFDLENDPHELRNLAGNPAQEKRVTTMLAKLRTRMDELGDELVLPAAIEPAPQERR